MDALIAQAPKFMLVFIRIGSFISFVPFFENRNFIIPVKVGLSFLLSLLLFPSIDTSAWVIPTHVPGFLLTVTQEILIGILMGLCLMILLFALQFTGYLIGFQMAFSMANAVDLTFGENDNILSVFLVMLGTMLLLTMNGDHFLLYTLTRSFSLLIPGSIAVTRNLVDELSRMIIRAFEIGFKVASPAVILLLCIDVTLGIIGRTASKMQIFFVGLPLKIAVGLFSFTVILSIILSIWSKEVERLPREMMNILKLMRV